MLAPRQSGALLPGAASATKPGKLPIEPWGASMSVDTSGGHPAMDYAEHNRTYAGFIRFSIAGIVFCVAILVFLAIFVV